jgi:hypothetical protein
MERSIPYGCKSRHRGVNFRALRIIFARKKKDEVAGWSGFPNEELHNFCS